MNRDVAAQLLARHGIQPSAQRLAVGEYVLSTHEHPSADKVFAEVRAHIPMISRATVYNTLNLLVRQGLLRELFLAEGKVVFDPVLEPHHHFVDDATGAILDVPWQALDVRRVEELEGLDVREYQVILRGRVAPDRLPSADGAEETGDPAARRRTRRAR
jgi:Fe2+ or Zn2+ uptake regulation protein